MKTSQTCAPFAVVLPENRTHKADSALHREC